MSDDKLPEIVPGNRSEAKRKIDYALKDYARGRAQLMELGLWYAEAHPEIAAMFGALVDATAALEQALTNLDGSI